MFDLSFALDFYTLVNDFRDLLSLGPVLNKRDFIFNIASDFQNTDLVIMDLLIREEILSLRCLSSIGPTRH